MGAVVTQSFASGKFDDTFGDRVDGVIGADADAFAGEEFGASLADYNSPRFGNLTVI